jgi:histone H3/H4
LIPPGYIREKSCLEVMEELPPNPLPPDPALDGAAAEEATTTQTKKATTTKKKTATKATGAGTQAKAKKPAPRVRKKPPPKSTPSATNVLANGRAAVADLAQQRAQAAARKSDPLWYRMEDVLPYVQDVTRMAPTISILPEQATIVESSLKYNGLSRSDVTPQAMACLLEQARRYAIELVSDAQDFAQVANRSELARQDILLAYELRADHPVAISTQLPKLNLVARQVNQVPLPPIPAQCYNGVLLPPKEHQLVARTYDVVTAAHVAQRMIQRAPSPPPKTSAKNTAEYGAARGRPIPIKLKETADPSVQQQPQQQLPVQTATVAAITTDAAEVSTTSVSAESTGQDNTSSSTMPQS